MKVNRLPKMPTQHAMMNAFALPLLMRMPPKPDPKMVPRAGSTFMRASLRSFFDWVSQPYFASMNLMMILMYCPELLAIIANDMTKINVAMFDILGSCMYTEASIADAPRSLYVLRT